jgi:hypothetical protein
MIGLGRKFISPQTSSGPLFFDSLRANGALKNGIFSLFLVNDAANGALK